MRWDPQSPHERDKNCLCADETHTHTQASQCRPGWSLVARSRGVKNLLLLLLLCQVKLDTDGVMSSEHTVSSYELWATVINFKPTVISMVTGFSVDHVS